MASGQLETRAREDALTSKLREAGALPDEQLLDRFLSGSGEQAEDAFRAIVVRHGPMVLGVCRHVLIHQQDAEDAFQAAFLVLARKAASIHDRRVLGRWLYEVAYRIALRAKSGAMRRRANERQGAEMLVTAPETDAGWSELRPVLHEEINRLPDKYRSPVVLCYLEGKTNEEVAQLLKWPVGTVKGRLSRAREMLRSRLSRRGLALSAAFLLTALSHNAVFAEVVPTRLIDSTVSSAIRIAKRGPVPVGADSPDLAPPPDWTPKNLWQTRLRPKHLVASKVLVIAVLLAALGGLASRAWGLFPTIVSIKFQPNSLVPIFAPPPSSGSCH
jgi:RNA polymerase sigma factor (sigma-70 family)